MTTDLMLKFGVRVNLHKRPGEEIGDNYRGDHKNDRKPVIEGFVNVLCFYNETRL